jgi:hypothetical protein
MVLPLDAYGPAFAALILAPDSGPVDNVRAATTSWQQDDSRDDMVTRGRVDGYSLWYQSSDPVNAEGAATGVFAVGSSVEAMAGAAAASDFLRDDLAYAERSVGDEVMNYINLGAASGYDVDGVGDESQGVIFRLDPVGNRSTWLTGVVFRRGDIVASIYVSRLDDADASAEATRLASLLDERIDNAQRLAGIAPTATPAPSRARLGAPPPPDFEVGSSLGMRCSYPSRFLRELYGLAPGEGCVILRLTTGGAAERAGVRIGDRLVRVDDTPVTSGRQFVFEVLDFGQGPHQIWTVERGAQQITIDFWWGQPGGAPADDPYAEYLAGRDNVQDAVDIAHLTAAIEQDPTFDLAYLYRGQKRYNVALRTGGDPFDAQADVLEALRLDPDLPEAHETLAQMLSTSSSSIPQALVEINTAIRLSGCDASPEYWDYDCGALLHTRARIWLMQLVPDDIRAEADLTSAGNVRSLADDRHALLQDITNARVNNAFRNGTCERDGVEVPCEWSQ